VDIWSEIECIGGRWGQNVSHAFCLPTEEGDRGKGFGRADIYHTSAMKFLIGVAAANTAWRSLAGMAAISIAVLQIIVMFHLSHT
jgi:hypothetical protein